MNNKPKLDETYIRDIKAHFRKEYQGKIDSDIIESTLNSFETLNTNEHHDVGVLLKGFAFYAHVTVTDLKSEAKFDGNAGGIGAGLGASEGNLFTAGDFSFDDLYKQTVSFQITSLIAYVSINFFNAQSQLLGHVQAVSLGLGFIGGGRGYWSI